VQPFRYLRARDRAEALRTAAPDARFLGGGTTLIDLMKLGVENPASVVDINHLGGDAAAIAERGGTLRVGALVRNSDLAFHPVVRRQLPALSQALLSGASAQLRNMATVGGNLMQRTRCAYFRDVGTPACNKRAPGSGCAAQEGWNRMHAVLGGSERCIAVHPSDMCVALVALEAVVHVDGPRGTRDVPVADFHTLPGEHPEIETALAPGELIIAVSIPLTPLGARSVYLKVRDRASFAFALASAAVAVQVSGGKVSAARVALGGLATKPWRSEEAERALVGRPASRATYQSAATLALRDARAHRDNAFKVELGKRTLVRALEMAGGAA
jgi:xanthine dehydrogenase YagS FAD-binding subunit